MPVSISSNMIVGAAEASSRMTFSASMKRDISPPEAIAAEVLRHEPLSVALVILMIEWMTQSHYLDSVRDDGGIDPLFKSLLRHHWMEEAQHAKLDTLVVETLAEGRSEAEIAEAIDGFLDIGMFIDGGLKVEDVAGVAGGNRAGGRERADGCAAACRAARGIDDGSKLSDHRQVPCPVSRGV